MRTKFQYHILHQMFPLTLSQPCSLRLTPLFPSLNPPVTVAVVIWFVTVLVVLCSSVHVDIFAYILSSLPKMFYSYYCVNEEFPTTFRGCSLKECSGDSAASPSGPGHNLILVSEDMGDHIVPGIELGLAAFKSCPLMPLSKFFCLTSFFFGRWGYGHT